MGSLGQNDLIDVVEVLGDKVCDMQYETKVAGTTFIKDSQSLLGFLSNQDSNQIILEFESEPTNKWDLHAVKVMVGMIGKKTRYHIGYIPKEFSEFFSYVMDGDTYDISVISLKILGGERYGVSNCGLTFKFKLTIRG